MSSAPAVLQGSSSSSLSAKLFFGKQPMPCLPGLRHDKQCERETPIRDDSGYDSATSDTLLCMWQNRTNQSICQWWKLLYWPNMGRFCLNFLTLEEYRESLPTVCIYLLYTLHHFRGMLHIFQAFCFLKECLCCLKGRPQLVKNCCLWIKNVPLKP